MNCSLISSGCQVAGTHTLGLSATVAIWHARCIRQVWPSSSEYVVCTATIEKTQKWANSSKLFKPHKASPRKPEHPVRQVEIRHTLQILHLLWDGRGRRWRLLALISRETFPPMRCDSSTAAGGLASHPASHLVSHRILHLGPTRIASRIASRISSHLASRADSHRENRERVTVAFQPEQS